MMKHSTKLLIAGVLSLGLVACSSSETPVTSPATSPAAGTTMPEVDVPSQAEANASAASAIDESNADAEFSALENEIKGDM